MEAQMSTIDGESAYTLAAVASAGTLDGAATAMRITPSAVSQRIKALEGRLGRPVLHRTRPLELTAAGEAVLRYARQLEQLEADLAADLSPGASRPQVSIVVNSDSLHTWALPPLAGLADRMSLEIFREDQAHSLDLLRHGRAAGAVTEISKPLAGCSTQRLGVMRYLAVARPAFVERWFGEGITAAALGAAPLVSYDRKDDLQGQCLRKLTRATLDPPMHFVPASAEYLEAIRWEMGWGMVPQIECHEDVRRGDLIHLDEQAVVDVPLYWQQWRRAAAPLREVAAALVAAAERVLR